MQQIHQIRQQMFDKQFALCEVKDRRKIKWCGTAELQEIARRNRESVDVIEVMKPVYNFKAN